MIFWDWLKFWGIVLAFEGVDEMETLYYFLVRGRYFFAELTLSFIGLRQSCVLEKAFGLLLHFTKMLALSRPLSFTRSLLWPLYRLLSRLIIAFLNNHALCFFDCPVALKNTFRLSWLNSPVISWFFFVFYRVRHDFQTDVCNLIVVHQKVRHGFGFYGLDSNLWHSGRFLAC